MRTDLLDMWAGVLIHPVAKTVERQHKDLTLCCHLEGVDGSGGGLCAFMMTHLARDWITEDCSAMALCFQH